MKRRHICDQCHDHLPFPTDPRDGASYFAYSLARIDAGILATKRGRTVYIYQVYDENPYTRVHYVISTAPRAYSVLSTIEPSDPQSGE